MQSDFMNFSHAAFFVNKLRWMFKLFVCRHAVRSSPSESFTFHNFLHHCMEFSQIFFLSNKLLQSTTSSTRNPHPILSAQEPLSCTRPNGVKCSDAFEKKFFSPLSNINWCQLSALNYGRMMQSKHLNIFECAALFAYPLFMVACSVGDFFIALYPGFYEAGILNFLVSRNCINLRKQKKKITQNSKSWIYFVSERIIHGNYLNQTRKAVNPKCFTTKPHGNRKFHCAARKFSANIAHALSMGNESF